MPIFTDIQIILINARNIRIRNLSTETQNIWWEVLQTERLKLCGNNHSVIFLIVTRWNAGSPQYCLQLLLHSSTQPETTEMGEKRKWRQAKIRQVCRHGTSFLTAEHKWYQEQKQQWSKIIQDLYSTVFGHVIFIAISNLFEVFVSH